MNTTTSPSQKDLDDEIAALVATLHRTEQRLEQLTGGEVDTVSDSEGRMFILNRAQAQIRHGEAVRQAAILNALPANFALLDSLGNIISTNEAWRQFSVFNLLRDPQLEVGRNYLDVCDRAKGSDADEAHQVAKGIRSVLGGTKSFSLEYPCHSPTEQRWFLMTATPIAGATAHGVVVMHLNITERRRAERDLKDAKVAAAVHEGAQRYHFLADTVPLIIWTARPDGGIDYYNKAWFDYTGLTLAQTENWGWDAVVHPDDLRRCIDRWTRSFTTGEDYEIEYRFKRASDGTYRWFLGRASARHNDKGEIVQWVGTGTDIDDQKRAHSELERKVAERTAELAATNDALLEENMERKQVEVSLLASKRRFKTLFDQVALGVALADVSTNKFVQVNQRYCEITGYSPEELEHLAFAEISHPEDTIHDLEIAEKLKAGTLREYTREKRYRRKDHSEIWVSLTISAMWAPDETPDLFIAIVQDITARKRLEEQVRQTQKMEAVGTLAGGIAHDFNNILSAINGYTELSLMMLDENPEVRAHLSAILKAAGRATGLVRQILAFSRQQVTTRHLISLGPVVTECTALLRATIPTTIEFATTLAPDAPRVLADATQIHQILMNLGTNAWHAMKDHAGRLEIKLERCVVDAAYAARQTRLRPGVYARVEVSDTGCGMDQATRLRIFEPFFTTKPVGEGTGLGLSVVHGIMDGHEGAITVHSTPGKGTVFRLYFPEKTGVETPTTITEDELPRGHGERILVVDDEDLLVQLSQMALTELGYEVEAMTKPAEAFARVSADPHRFALVLTDQTMPGMTGLELATRLQAIRPGLPVILTTGYLAALTSKEIEAAGIRQLVSKPATLHTLATAISAALPPR